MPRRFKIVIVPLLAAVVAGGTHLVASGGAHPAAQRKSAVVTPATDDKTIIHVLNRLGFGPTPAAVAHVREVGVSAYIDEQLRPERIADTSMAARLEAFATLTKSTRELAETYFLPAMLERREQQRRNGQDPLAQPSDPSTNRLTRSPEQMQTQRLQRTPIMELSEQKVLRAAYSERQLEEALVDFWFNHFNVFVGKGQVRLYLTEYERDAIRPHVLGKFRDLLGATAHSPAMLFYLDNFQSAAAEGAPTSADARGTMRRPGMQGRRQPFGRPQARRPLPDAMPNDRPQPQPARRRGLNENYARELMELHTLGVDGGYTQKDVQEVARAFTGWTIDAPRMGGTFRFDPRLHDDGEKVVLGHRIKSGGGMKDGEEILDLLTKQPATAQFIATKLARRFVSDTPPPALVTRAAERFRQTDGNIREVVRTIVTSPEFFAAESYRAKVKSPFEFVVSAVRATSLDAVSAVPLVAALRDLGMPLYGAQPPTGYPDRADAWVNSGALLNRMNFALSLTGGQMRALRPPAASRAAGPEGVDAARSTLFTTALAGDVSESTVATVARATTAPQAVALILGSPEFQKR
jgi:uncharacterized protein (DUF1800 family)